MTFCLPSPALVPGSRAWLSCLRSCLRSLRPCVGSGMLRIRRCYNSRWHRYMKSNPVAWRIYGVQITLVRGRCLAAAVFVADAAFVLWRLRANNSLSNSVSLDWSLTPLVYMCFDGSFGCLAGGLGAAVETSLCSAKFWLGGIYLHWGCACSTEQLGHQASCSVLQARVSTKGLHKAVSTKVPARGRHT